MKFVALLSGGKDSIYATLQAIENGHELICCAHLAPSTINNDNNLEEESYMYQTAGSEAVRMQVQECMGLPFHVREIRGRSTNTALVYHTSSDSSADDEVEDLYLLLKEIQMKHPDISALSSGAILSTYQRTRIEHVCSRLNLTSLSYLWRMSSQRSLLDSILDDGQIDAVLVRVACPPGLMPYRHLGKSLRELRDRGILDQLNERYGMNPAGEGGEYETLVLDCPKLFKFGRLVLDETEVICDESDDGVGILKIIKCSVETKTSGGDEPNSTAESGLETVQRITTDLALKSRNDDLPTDSNEVSIPSEISSNLHLSMNLPTVRLMKGGLCHISALLSPIPSNQLNNESASAVQEFLIIQQMLHAILSRLFPGDQPPTSAQDVVYVHLYLSEMSHFAKINQYYRQFFGTHQPPSRACVAVGKGALPGGRRVMMDCILQRGSGAYLRNENGTISCDKCDTFLEKALQNKHNFLRKTLHVQSISSWAPVCIGPYSQANSIRSSIVLLAGMIGLVPQSMTLIQPTSSDVSDFEVQLYQSWKNAAAVLDGFEDGGGMLDDCLGGLVYVSIDALESLASVEDEEEVTFSWQRLWNVAKSISSHALSTNAGFVMGGVDGIAANNPRTTADPHLYDEDGVLFGGYEDEETWREISCSTTTPSLSPLKPSDDSGVPLLMICVPELPAHACAEVELILASRRAASCLDVSTGSLVNSFVQSSDKGETSASDSNHNMLWDTGYDHINEQMAMELSTSRIEISSIARFVGRGCACVSTVIAKLPSCNKSMALDANEFCFDLEDVLSRMIDSSINNAKGKNEMSSLFTIAEVLNVRLYYMASSFSRKKKKTCTVGNGSSMFEVEMKDDGSSIRTHLHSVLQLKSNSYHVNANTDRKCRSGNVPAYTVVPVLGLHMSGNKDGGTPILAMQVIMVDMIRMETEIWVRHNRQYEYDK